MTDKQIIIDGCDVSGCEYWKGYCRIASLCDYPGHLCEVTPNCYYKQLKRLEKLLPDINGKFYKAMDDLKAKEQECEKLKNWVKNMMFDTDRNDWFEHFAECFENWKEDLFKQLDQLKGENEELKQYKEVVDKLAGMQVILTNEEKMPMLYENAKDLKLKQLSQTLTEIKEIAEEKANVNDWLALEILQKISEVENEQTRNFTKKKKIIF